MTRIPRWFTPYNLVTFTTDKSKGFGDPRFPLYVPGADLTVAKSQAFLEAVDHVTRRHIATCDLHFTAEYPFSNESALFPPHQMYGTEETDSLIDFSRMQAPVIWFFKNVFDIGGSVGDSGVNPATVLTKMDDPVERTVFLNLFTQVAGDLRKPKELVYGQPRDVFFQSLRNKGVRTSLHLGDATDYCVRDAMKYMLNQGFENVVLLTDLTSGIYNTSIPGGVGSLDELIATDPVLKDGFEAGLLSLTTSDDMLELLKDAA